MDAFAQIIQSCATSRPRLVGGRNRTELIRRHLEEFGRCDAAELGAAADVEPNRVRSLLKYDIDAGRVEIVGEKGLQSYRIVINPPPDLPTIKAIKLLIKLGYSVTEPTGVARLSARSAT